MALSKESLLTRNAATVKEVSLPDGESVFLKPLPASFFIGKGKNKGKEKTDEEKDAAAQIAASLCDPDGNLFFDPVADRDEILSLSLADFNALLREIMIVNGLIKPEGEEPTDAEKN